MKPCSECNLPTFGGIEQGSLVFCSKGCQKSFAQRPTTITCGKCGTANALDNEHCKECNDYLYQYKSIQDKQTQRASQRRRMIQLLPAPILLCVVMIGLYTHFHILYDEQGLRFVRKVEMSFAEPMVSLTELSALPYIMAKAKYPLTLAALERDNIIDTYEERQEKIRQEIDVETQKLAKRLQLPIEEATPDSSEPTKPEQNKETATIFSSQQFIREDGINVRSAPSTKAVKIFTAPVNFPLLTSDETVEADNYTWVKVKLLDHKEGWVAKPFLQASPDAKNGHNQPEIYHSNTDKLNVREWPTTQAKSITTLGNGELVNTFPRRISNDGQIWVAVEVNSQQGWVSQKYIYKDSEKPTFATDSSSDSQRLLTYMDYLGIYDGMSCSTAITQLPSIGFREVSSSEFGDIKTVMYSWQNPSGSAMTVMCQNGVVISKAQFGLD